MVAKSWWEQKALDLVGMRMVDWEAEQMKVEEDGWDEDRELQIVKW